MDHGQGSSTLGASASMTEPRFLPSLVRSCAWGCRVLQAPAPHSSHSRCGCAIRTAGVPVPGLHPFLRPPAVLLYNYYYTITAHSARLPRARLATGEERAEVGWFASWELSRGQGDRRGAALQGGGGESPPGELARAAGLQRPPPSSSRGGLAVLTSGS